MHSIRLNFILAGTVLAVSLSGSAFAATSRFVVSASGEEVTDNQTSLIWQRCSVGQVWDGQTCAGSASGKAWGAALAFAQDEAARTGMAWRLPNIKEMASLLKRDRSPHINAEIFPMTSSSSYWTSTPYQAGHAACVGSVGIGAASAASGGGCVWYVNFSDDWLSSLYDADYAEYAVRLVRNAK